MIRKPIARNIMYTLLSASITALAGCNQAATPAQNPAASGTAPAPAQSTAAAPQAAPAYTPPTADQLYQMVAPIALFPDKLVAQVLAGSTYPDQITAADNVVTQNPNLTGASLQTAIAQQPWDASVKGLTAFPSVLDQMAKNIDWTTALGDAYVNDPTDVMNAIQVMRQRASAKGNLRSSAQLNVTTQSESAPPPSYADNSDGSYPVYAGPAVVPAPGQVIEIAPAQPDTVYVPQYNPQTVYGEEVPDYPGYAYASPQGYSTGEVVAVGALSFGAGILIGNLFEHHHDHQDYGWNNWGMNWGGRPGGYGRGNGGWQRPAVVYNNSTYVSRSTTVVNHYVTNNINNSRTTINNNSNNRIAENRYAGQGPANQPMNRAAIGPANERPGEAAQHGAASLPHFGPGATGRGLPAAGVAAGAGAAAAAGAVAAARAHNTPGNHAAPMSMPHFAANPQHGAPAERTPDNAERAQAAHAPARETAAPQSAARPVEAPHPQPAARPVEAPRPQPAARPMEAPRPQPAARPMEAPRPQPQQRPTAAPHPQPANHKPAPAHPDNKKDKDHQ